MEKFYSFAGVDVAVSIPQDKMYDEERHLAPFRVDAVTDPHYFRFETVKALEAPRGPCVASPPGLRVYREGTEDIRYIGSVSDSWEPAYIRAVHRGKKHEIQLLESRFPGSVGAKTVLNCLGAEHLVTETGGFVLHCSCIDYMGSAVLFTAPSGVGKSTQAELWRSLRGTEIINGDRAVIRCAGDNIYACGIPFAGSSAYCLNRSLPLAAVVYLAQAPATSVRRLRGYEAFSRLWEGCSVNTWDRGDMRMVSELVTQVAGSVPVYYLPCTPDESAVTALETALKEGHGHD